MTSSDNCWISAGNYWVGWLNILLRDTETFASGKEKIEKIELEKSWKIEEIEEIDFFEAAAVGETGWHSKHHVL